MGNIVTRSLRHFSSRAGAAAPALAAALLAPLSAPLLSALLSALLAGCQAPPRSTQAPVEQARYRLQDFGRLPSIADDDWRGAWPAWLATCARLSAHASNPSSPGHARWAAWQGACERASAVDAQDAPAIRRYLQTEFDVYRLGRIEAPGADAGADPFRPRPVGRSERGLITGYYEPLLHGRRAPDERFSVPIYRVPSDLVRVELADTYPQLRGLNLRGRLDQSGDTTRVKPYWTREEIERQDRLRGSELIWVDDALAAFLLQVQGSGRAQLDDGTQIRLAYADTNGQPYRSIGRWLVEHGELTVEQASLQGIRDWAQAHPDRVRELLFQNPSVVFFRETELGDPLRGPAGALGAPLTPGYSAAVDPRYVPLGAPVIIQSVHPVTGAPLVRPVMAQDTGGAISGPIRLDLFWGFGPTAEEAAGRQRAQGAVWILTPKGQDPRNLVAP